MSTTTVPPALPANVIKLKFPPKKARNRREEYQCRLFRQAKAGDVGADAEWRVMGLRDDVFAGERISHYWLEELTAVLRRLRRLAGKKALGGWKRTVA